MIDESRIQELLQAADRSAPRPPVRPVSLQAMHVRLRRRRLRVAALVLVALAPAPWLFRPEPPRSAAPPANLAGLRAEVARLLQAVTELQRNETGPSSDTRLALERSAMASYAYGEILRERGDRAAAEHFQRVARIWPGTAGGRLAGRRLETRERSER